LARIASTGAMLGSQDEVEKLKDPAYAKSTLQFMSQMCGRDLTQGF
jgi:hypothetical protein